VRLLVPLLLIGLTGAHTSAAACPRGALCLTADARPMETAAPAPARTVTPLRVSLRAPADPLPALRFAGERRRPAFASDLPWIWAALRERVYAQLPTQRSESLTLTLAPVVVTGQVDTIPGVGVAGAFD